MSSKDLRVKPVPLIVLFIALTGGVWGLIGAHAASPHKGSLSRAEFQLEQRWLQRELSQINTRLQAIRNDIKELRNERDK